MAQRGVFLTAACNSLQFYPANWQGLTVYGQVPYWRSIQKFQSNYQEQPYLQKVCFTDVLTIQVHTPLFLGISSSTVPQLYITDLSGNVISSYGPGPTTLNLNVTPYLKGFQFTGNSDITNGVTTALVDTTWSFSMGTFFSAVANSMPSTYMLRCDYHQVQDDGTQGDILSTYSEPFILSTFFENTQQYQSGYFTNNKKFEVIQGGWFNDFPTNTQSYQLLFGVRAESYAISARSGSKGVNIGYYNQSYMQVQNQTNLLLPVWDLKVGEICLGIPYYMLDKLSACIQADNFALLNSGDTLPFGYKLWNPNSNTSPADIWKTHSFDDVSSLLKAGCQLQQTAGRGLYTPMPNPSHVGQYAASDYSSDYST